MAAAVAPCAQAQTRVAAPDGKATVFLADPQLGVVGGYRSGGDIVYFEARPGADGSIAARLVDARGVTIAIAGTAPDASWTDDAAFDKASATRSAALATRLAPALAQALPDAAFGAERASLAALAREARSAGDLSEVVHAQSLDAASDTAARAAWQARDAAKLSYWRDANGEVRGTFGGVTLQALERRVADTLDETPDGMRSEVYARIATAQGRALVTQLGGDDVPAAWLTDTAAARGDDVFAALADLGAAVAAAQAVAQTVGDDSAEGEALARIGLSLRDRLLPSATPPVDAKSSVAPTATIYKRTDIEIWKKSLAGPLAEHSGTKIYHYHDWGTTYSLHDTVLLCNHGTCPGSGPMRVKCLWVGPNVSAWRNPPIRSSGDGLTHSCNTGYGLDSFFRHNCHDDSWTQLKWIKGQGSSASPDNNRCHDAAVYKSAPKCSD